MKLTFILRFAGMLVCASVLNTSAATAVTETVLYRFCHLPQCSDGDGPQAGLIYLNGTLYGTTLGGGTRAYGTVFSITPSGSEKVVHSFGGDNTGDGIFPIGGLTNVNGTLYGTTYTGGGANGDGIVFSVSPGGAYKLLHSFGSYAGDGILPYAGLVNRKGTLYGTTINGGESAGLLGAGTVFSITPGGKEKVVYSFCQQVDCADGELPQANLIKADDMLYGTTYGGPACQAGYSPGCGTIFSLNPTTGAEKVLYSFCQQKNCSDGVNPLAGVIYVGGTLFGTAFQSVYGYGVVFSLTLGGAFRVLHSFSLDNGDGWYPYSGLVYVHGTLYGTTGYGGTGNCLFNATPVGCGTVYSINPQTGAESVIYSFQGGRDGANPYAPLISVDGTLYGTTRGGGGTVRNAGTVFSITP